MEEGYRCISLFLWEEDDTFSVPPTYGLLFNNPFHDPITDAIHSFLFVRGEDDLHFVERDFKDAENRKKYGIHTGGNVGFVGGQRKYTIKAFITSIG